MSPKAVFLDFGGTLANPAREVEEPWRMWSRVAHEFGLGIEDSIIQETNREADRLFHERMYEYHGRTDEFWRLRDTWMMDQLGIRNPRSEFFEALQRAFEDPSLVRPYPETAEVLHSLRSKGKYVGIISNYTDRLLILLDHYGLRGYLDSVTYSQEVGAEKPDPRIFAVALSRAGCPPGEAVHVGDSWESDYLGAKRAGMIPVLLNRGRQPPREECLEIQDLRSLLGLLGRLP